MESIYTTISSQLVQKNTTENVLNEKPLIFHSKYGNKLFSHATDNNVRLVSIDYVVKTLKMNIPLWRPRLQLRN